MKGSHVVAIVAMGAGGLYLLSRWNVSRGGAPLLPDFGLGLNAPNAASSGDLGSGGIVPTNYGYRTNANFPTTIAAPNRAPSPVLGAVSGVGATGIAAGVGLVGAAAVATAGIAAGVGLLAWGIADKGWFRGGEEGVKVNPARDRFLAQFASYDYMRDNSNPPGFYGLSSVLTILGRHELFDALTRVTTMGSFTTIINDIQSALSTATAAQLAQAKAMSRY